MGSGGEKKRKGGSGTGRKLGGLKGIQEEEEVEDIHPLMHVCTHTLPKVWRLVYRL